MLAQVGEAPEEGETGGFTPRDGSGKENAFTDLRGGGGIQRKKRSGRTREPLRG